MLRSPSNEDTLVHLVVRCPTCRKHFKVEGPYDNFFSSTLRGLLHRMHSHASQAACHAAENHTWTKLKTISPRCFSTDWKTEYALPKMTLDEATSTQSERWPSSSRSRSRSPRQTPPARQATLNEIMASLEALHNRLDDWFSRSPAADVGQPSEAVEPQEVY